MHKSAEVKMKACISKYMPSFDNPTVVEFGSRIVGGRGSSHRPLFEKYKCRYIGLDQSAGDNVDVIMEKPYSIPLETNSMDIIISGQYIEHIPYVMIIFMELARILKPGGMIFCTAPSRGHAHAPPYDAWRFMPDSYKSLAVFSGLHLHDASFDAPPKKSDSNHFDYSAIPESEYWGDVLGVFLKTQTYDEKRVAPVRALMTNWANECADVHMLNSLYAPDLDLERKNLTKHKAFNVWFPNAPEIITDRILLSLGRGHYEAKEARALLKYLKKGARILELGAGLGFMACIANQKKPSAYIAVEADHRVIPVMRETHRINGIENVLIHNCAVTSSPEELQAGYISLQFGNEFWGSSVKPKSGSGEFTKVQTVSLSTYISTYNPDTLIIDIEGAEVDLFNDVDLSGIRLIVMEIHPSVTGRQSVKDLFALLQSSSLKIAEKNDEQNMVVFTR